MHSPACRGASLQVMYYIGAVVILLLLLPALLCACGWSFSLCIAAACNCCCPGRPTGKQTAKAPLL
eukprot:6194169-Pleurochrysis_carterae.AAC.2